ncbi:trihelix transcription factor DF1-like [Typha angustifolia]|uniref:trihelix transcription factor DF1-like n=1 Tax=Typha angustifolia TaxID=59011 RepID=UPI003C2DBF22
MTPFSMLAEAASPISSRPPPPTQNYEDLIAGSAGGNFPDEEALAGGGDEVSGGGTPGNRWPRQETLALLKIRSEMDAAFRDATLKSPLWEEVSRKLAELGYKRSAKKCKEKFENVHKYYKRTKDGRAGRQDGKSYRFFSQLEALHAATPASNSAAMVGPPAVQTQVPSIPASAAIAPPPLSAPLPGVGNPWNPQPFSGPTAAGISFSSNTTSSFESSESDDEETADISAGQQHEKRKRKSGSSGSSKRMKAFFERLMKDVKERQEAMQQHFLETIKKREQDRMIREEAWRRQEMARASREQEILAQERAMAASRDAAIVSFIQKFTGQTIQLPPMPATAITTVPPPQLSPAPPPPPPPQQQQLQIPPQTQQQKKHHQRHQITDMVAVPEPQDPFTSGAGFEMSPSSSRWPRVEVHALIQLRSGLDSRYQEAGPKGPLWEEISAGMKRMGYNRSSKRCKEKWENINKYFKKVKESNKKRPEDAKTCPYFHQLDALYRKKQQQQQGINTTPNSQQLPTEGEDKNDNNNTIVTAAPAATAVIQTSSNGGLATSFYEEGNNGDNLTMDKQAGMDDNYDKLDEPDSDNMDQDDKDDEDDDGDDGKMQYEIQFQRQNSTGVGGNASNTTTSAPAAATTTTSSFLGMVQ